MVRPHPTKRPRFWQLTMLLPALALSGCMQMGDAATEAAQPTPIPAEQTEIAYHISKLPDRDHIRTYGDKDNPRIWYIAAEALGEIGEAAIPALITRLDSNDPYELMLALYALMLASQDPVLMDKTDGDYLRLGVVLTEETNADNRRLARAWWARHRHLWAD